MPNAYAVMGATGQIGREIVGHLLRRGHRVKALGRNKEKLAALQSTGAIAYSVDFTETVSLTEIFRGVDAVFALIPPAYAADDFEAYQDQAGEAITKALATTGVPKVIDLSSLGAHLEQGTGPIKGLHRQEKRLEAVPHLGVLHLRASYFMQNFYWSIPAIHANDVMAGTFRPDLPIWMVSTSDVATKAFEILDKLDFTGHGAFEFVGPQPVTMNEAAETIGKAIGKPDLKYIRISYEEQRKALARAGMKPGIVDLMVEMNQGVNGGLVAPTQEMAADHRGKTTLGSFAANFAEHYSEYAKSVELTRT